MKKVLAGLGVFTFFAAVSAQAQPPERVTDQPGVYVDGQLGGSFTTSDTFDNSVNVGGGIGYRFTPNLRLAGIFTYRPDFGADRTNWTLLGNGYYDFNTVPLGPFVPYVKGGIGLAHNERGDDTSDDFAWDVGAGLSYPLAPQTALDIDYQYTDMGTPPGTTAGLQAHEIKLGLRYQF